MARWLALAALLVAAAGCVGGEPAEAFESPDRVIAGPQGGVGQFVVECALSHRAADDPIVVPGRPGGSHLHQFYGATAANANSTYDEVLAGSTTCEQRADTASYWAPVLIDAGQHVVEPVRSVAYYRAGIDVDPSDVVPFPADMMLVAGDAGASEPQPLSIVSWSCGTGAQRSTTPPRCADSATLRMSVTYQDCWDGEHLRSPIVVEPDLHVAYSADGECPDSHPVHIPQLQFAIDYPPVEPDGLALSSGDILTGHADFWNTWDQEKLEREVAHCIGRDVPCGITD